MKQFRVNLNMESLKAYKLAICDGSQFADGEDRVGTLSFWVDDIEYVDFRPAFRVCGSVGRDADWDRVSLTFEDCSRYLTLIG
jgi:hypothetical protein